MQGTDQMGKTMLKKMINLFNEYIQDFYNLYEFHHIYKYLFFGTYPTL